MNLLTARSVVYIRRREDVRGGGADANAADDWGHD